VRYVANEFIHATMEIVFSFFIYLFEYILQILAAHRCGITRVILPERNLKDLVEVPAAVLANLEVFCFHFTKVLSIISLWEHSFQCQFFGRNLRHKTCNTKLDLNANRKNMPIYIKLWKAIIRDCPGID
jgi:uncharacterized protein (DUF486 family)